jgi:XTP/dITP diphosphohydrolase
LREGFLELFLATRNEGKIREIRELLEEDEISLTSLRDYPDAPEVVENGEAFRDNALKKARFFAKWTGKTTLADDSGLEVDCLEGRPGVLSARYAGDGADDRENNRKLLRELEGIPVGKREAGSRVQMRYGLGNPTGRCRGGRGGMSWTNRPRGEGEQRIWVRSGFRHSAIW